MESEASFAPTQISDSFNKSQVWPNMIPLNLYCPNNNPFDLIPIPKFSNFF